MVDFVKTYGQMEDLKFSFVSFQYPCKSVFELVINKTIKMDIIVLEYNIQMHLRKFKQSQYEPFMFSSIAELKQYSMQFLSELE